MALLDRAERRGWRRVLTGIKQPMLAWVAAAAILGGFALWGVIGRGSGGTTAQSQVPLPAMVTAPGTAPASSPQRTSRPKATRRHHPRRAAATPATPATPAGQPTPRQPGPATATEPASRPAAHPSAGRGAPAVLVRYVIDSTSGASFHGEVDVVNNGRRPLSDWQIVVALDGDEVTAVQNATGFDSNGILLMQPAVSTEVVPPDGGTLRVFFAAQGSRTIPLACAFNDINCQ